MKDESLVITAWDGEEAIFTYDRAGRLFAAWVGQRLYRRALDGRMIEKHTVTVSGVRTPLRRLLPPEEASTCLDRAAHVAAAAAAALERGEVDLLWTASTQPSLAEAGRMVAAAASFDSRASRLDAARFFQVYRPVGILPPDQYMALVLQVTEGCHWNRCAFCTFYRGVPFRVKPLPEFAAHVEAVGRFLGEGVSLRRAIFLGEANALLLPVDDLLARLLVVAEWSRRMGREPGPVGAFLDVFTGKRRTVEDFTRLRAAGLRRVYLGVESGDDGLLRLLNKPQQAADVAALVQTLKAAGLAVGVVVLAGIGGREFARSHVARTLGLLNSLPLGPGDLIYLSAYRPPSERQVADRTQDVRPLSQDETRAQLRALQQGLRFPPGRSPRVARYDVEEFIY
ncbi:MAG: radical SAM protein [Armatimonadota bacterium]|nr:radical SAM protein [Armatimonadota bacterium]MDR7427687.1 radical SAM protein [Armatimonadota bacterium]MDR7463997.1 radical SAM protein [Armatimonadota bacterium]MDR7470286.1 radical SAM protein [Armatimonadota bacterium]MDR7475385.1 radical SAM protein [Armatimonadota bacterium]